MLGAGVLSVGVGELESVGPPVGEVVGDVEVGDGEVVADDDPDCDGDALGDRLAEAWPALQLRDGAGDELPPAPMGPPPWLLPPGCAEADALALDPPGCSRL
jgi:hypothetical protein